MRNFNWKPFIDKKPFKKKVSSISKQFGLSKIASEVLIRRGFNNPDIIKKYLYGNYNNLYSPWLFKDMMAAVSILQWAKNKHKKIFIHGDYDCDGVSSTALIKNLCDDLGIKSIPYVPQRNMGYGLSKRAVNYAIEKKTDILITCDCGSNEISAINHARRNGLMIIVLDHHHFDKRPKADAFINPEELYYPFKDLCAAGVAFKLIQAMAEREKNIYPENYLDIVAVATIADAVPLIDENRILVKEGLKRIKTLNTGIHHLIKASGLLHRKITPEVVGYIIAPKINAAGRIDNPQKALDLLLEIDPQKTDKIAHNLVKINKQRMAINDKIRDEAIDMVEKYFKDDPFLVLSADGWHQGVIGIVASTLTEIYNKPTIIIAKEYGSARTIPEYSLLEPLKECEDLLVKWGGHPMAAGITIKKKNITAFRKKINKIAEKVLPSHSDPVIRYDSKLKLKDIDFNLVKELEKLEPFGQGNILPKFVIEDINIARDRITDDGQHLQLSIKQGNNLTSAIGFWMSPLSELLKDPAQKFDVLFYIGRNKYNTEQIILKDIKEVKLNW